MTGDYDDIVKLLFELDNLTTIYYKVVTILLNTNQITTKFIQPCCKLATTKKDIHKALTTL